MSERSISTVPGASTLAASWCPRTARRVIRSPRSTTVAACSRVEAVALSAQDPLVYSTFLGGQDGFESVGTLAVRADGTVYLDLRSEDGDLPVMSPNAVYPMHIGGGTDSWIAVLGPVVQ